MKTGRSRGCMLAAAGCATSVIVAIVLGVIVLRVTLTKYHQTTINMEPAIAKGDRVVTRRARTIRRGDIVALVMPTDGKMAIMRVVALPGDTIELREGRAVVNDVPLHEPYMSLREGPEPQLPVLRDMPAVRVPPGQYFVLGDNRDHANDSRYIGPVKRSAIRGRAVFVFSDTTGVRWL